MQAVWMYKLLVRYVQLLLTNFHHATLLQCVNASSVHCACGHAGRMDVQAVGQVCAASVHQC